MLEQIEPGMVHWARANFALTALYHFLFVPLTLGLSFLVAFMETLYVQTGREEWKRISKFWMKLFGINFAIGVATGLILEFEFGTNWANYSWLVGDIFGAPLAIEGMFAFFLEATFFAVMFFGWDRVSKKFHLFSTWMVAVGSNLSAFWILVANGWMQNPVGMSFNPDTMRNEMVSFLEVAFSPTAVGKFTHTTASGFVISSLFIIGISAWFMLKKRNINLARKSMVVGATFGLLANLFLILTGDKSAHDVAHTQPAKLAAMEGVYDGDEGLGITALGILNPSKKLGDDNKEFIGPVLELPFALSLLSFHDMNAYIPGMNDLVYGNEERGIISAGEKMERGKKAIQALKDYKELKTQGDSDGAETALAQLREHENFFGYGYLKSAEDIIPNVPITFYSFHIMVALGFYFLAFFAIVLHLSMIKAIEKFQWLLWVAVLTIPLGWVAAESGWIVAEVGRQPWAIQNMLPTSVATTIINQGSVMATFFIFLVLFTVLLIAEVGIMLKAIRNYQEEKNV